VRGGKIGRTLRDEIEHAEEGERKERKWEDQRKVSRVEEGRKRTHFDSASVNSISSIPSPRYQCKKAFRLYMLLVGEHEKGK